MFYFSVLLILLCQQRAGVFWLWDYLMKVEKSFQKSVSLLPPFCSSIRQQTEAHQWSLEASAVCESHIGVKYRQAEMQNTLSTPSWEACPAYQVCSCLFLHSLTHHYSHFYCLTSEFFQRLESLRSQPLLTGLGLHPTCNHRLQAYYQASPGTGPLIHKMSRFDKMICIILVSSETLPV